MDFTIKPLLAAMCMATLAACGDTPIEQGLLGAGAGAGAAAILDTNILTGAAIGAAGNVIYCQTSKRKTC